MRDADGDVVPGVVFITGQWQQTPLVARVIDGGLWYFEVASGELVRQEVGDTTFKIVYNDSSCTGDAWFMHGALKHWSGTQLRATDDRGQSYAAGTTATAQSPLYERRVGGCTFISDTDQPHSTVAVPVATPDDLVGPLSFTPN